MQHKMNIWIDFILTNAIKSLNTLSSLMAYWVALFMAYYVQNM